ncbi:MAG: class I SAM-dependent methyltransferase [Chloroflexota bacterium]|nr:class I SAM-dependent methyltransferase [Chloroflexota bacterium]
MSNNSFDRVAEEYDATRPIPRGASEEITDTILRVTGATQATEFLEVGVGTGRIGAPIVERGHRFTGVDISRKMMNEMLRKLPGERPNLTLVEADATALPFADASFDVALTVHLLHLVARWHDALAEIRRVLREGGVFLYGYEEHSADEALREVYTQWDTILAGRGVQTGPSGGNLQDVLAELKHQGARLETVIAAKWRAEITVGELMDLYERRVYSRFWRLPDDVFSDAVADLKEWSARRYPSEGFALSGESVFVLTVARHWASV